MITPLPAFTVHTKLALATLTPSVTVVVTLKAPAVLGVPLIAPVAVFSDKPGGKPLAPKVSVSPLGSVALRDRLAGVPTLVLCASGLASVGTNAGLVTG